MGSEWNDPLGALRWHWGEAYIICQPEPDMWIAQRRDTHETLRDTTPLGLRDEIISDYFRFPVSRDAAPLPREIPLHHGRNDRAVVGVVPQTVGLWHGQLRHAWSRRTE